VATIHSTREKENDPFPPSPEYLDSGPLFTFESLKNNIGGKTTKKAGK